MHRARTWYWAVALVLVAASAFAQGNPTGAISGQVVDPDNLALPGVTVTVESPVLQGVRTAVSSGNGDYIIPFLPPGDYTVTFELAGLPDAQAQPVQRGDRGDHPDQRQAVAGGGDRDGHGDGAGVPRSRRRRRWPPPSSRDIIERLPVGRTLQLLHAAGARASTTTGPNGNIMMSGALSYENLNLINGVVVNENLRGQARSLFIEDAIQETKVSTGSISAEYGRFQGGVVNTITKSGGNAFIGLVPHDLQQRLVAVAHAVSRATRTSTRRCRPTS